MKNLLVVLALVLLAGFSAEAQKKPWTLTGKRAIVDDSLRVGNTLTANGQIVANSFLDYFYADTNSFATTGTLDTVRVVGVTTATKVFAFPRRSTVATDSSGVMYGVCGTDTVFFVRESGGTSGLVYQYILIK